MYLIRLYTIKMFNKLTQVLNDTTDKEILDFMNSNLKNQDSWVNHPLIDKIKKHMSIVIVGRKKSDDDIALQYLMREVCERWYKQNNDDTLLTEKIIKIVKSELKVYGNDIPEMCSNKKE